MKHAYLIIAHNEPDVLKTLLLMLDDERNDPKIRNYHSIHD